MARTDGKRKTFKAIPVGAEYELTVSGSAGFASAAKFDDACNDTIETWPGSEITQAQPKKKALACPGGEHFVFIFVDIESIAPIDVVVTAKVGNQTYCRTVSGAAGTREILVHKLQMVAQ